MHMAYVPLLQKHGRAPSISQGTAIGSRPWKRSRAATSGGGQQQQQLDAKQLAAACSIYRLAAAAASAADAEGGSGRAGAAEARSSTSGPRAAAAAVVLGRWRLGVQAAGRVLASSSSSSSRASGALRLAAAVALPASLVDLTSNVVLMPAFWAWLLAQTLKIFTKRARKGVWDVMALFDSGGMPSSHSALCMGVTTSVALEFGLASPLFAVALCFSAIVMYDAAGVRRHAGKQAEVLNIIVGDLLEGHPLSEKKLKEVLGHTPLQVLCGGSLGVFISLLLRPAYAALA